MQYFVKLLISVCIIVLCTQIGIRLPKLAGLIAVMPLTGLIVMLWLYYDHPGDVALMTSYTKGALFGILPTILFFLVAYICFQKQLSLWIVLCASFAIRAFAAFLHQWLLK